MLLNKTPTRALNLKAFTEQTLTFVSWSILLSSFYRVSKVSSEQVATQLVKQSWGRQVSAQGSCPAISLPEVGTWALLGASTQGVRYLKLILGCGGPSCAL